MLLYCAWVNVTSCCAAAEPVNVSVLFPTTEPDTAPVTDRAVNQNVVLSGSLVLTGSQVISGSLRGEVKALSITSNTASMDCSTDNFFTLTLVNGTSTYLNPSNISSGQTINVRISQPATTGSGLITFPSSVKQVSGSVYTPTAGANAQDIITFISYDSTNLYLSNIKNFV